MTRIVLDTNAYRSLLAGDKKIAGVLVEASEIIVPVTVIGELGEAFRLGTKLQANKRRLNEFLQEPGVVIVPVGMETAEVYADIRVKLHRKGSPIPVNDVWIGASAIEHEAVLVTYDKHFANISGLRLWKG